RRSRKRWPRRREGRARWAKERPLGAQGVDPAGEPALVPGRRVVVHDALLGRPVDLADGLAEQLSRLGGVSLDDEGAESLDLALELRQVLPVARPALDGLPHCLQSRCVMGQTSPPLSDDKLTAYWKDRAASTPGAAAGAP